MIYISTKMYEAGNFSKVNRILDDIEGEVGIELFVKLEEEEFLSKVEENTEFLKEKSLTFHEPVKKIEHSAPRGTAEYQKTLETFTETLKLAEKLEPKFMVYHTHNKEVENKKEMIKAAEENLKEANSLTSIPLLIENIGIESKGTALFTQEEFITFALEQDNNIMLDLGHAQSNNWDLERVISTLNDKIAAYQLHYSQEGQEDHERAFSQENTGYMMVFLELYKKFTPKADLILEYSGEYEDREGILMLDVLRLKNILKI